jgi:hypothetical protein
MASNRFEDAFSDGAGSNRMTCSCGVTHFCSDDINYANGEYDALVNGLIAYPDRYRMHDEGIASMTIDGTVFVIGCDCDYPNKCEKFILNNGVAIAKYLNSMAKELEEKVKKIRLNQAFQFFIQNPQWKF